MARAALFRGHLRRVRLRRRLGSRSCSRRLRFISSALAAVAGLLGGLLLALPPLLLARGGLLLLGASGRQLVAYSGLAVMHATLQTRVIKTAECLGLDHHGVAVSVERQEKHAGRGSR